ncbi:hypothetical protein V2A60_008228 [Cordyceps javanica]
MAQEPPTAAGDKKRNKLGYHRTSIACSLTIPIPTEQSFNVSPGSSLAWGSAEPSPVTLPGSMDMSYHWNPYGSESGSAEQTSAFGSELATQSAWMATTPDTTQLSNWGWNNGVTPTTQGRSVSFSNDLIGQPQQQFVSNTSNGLYDGASANLETPFSPSINLTSVPGHPPSQNGELGGNWESQQQELVHQQQQQHQGHQEMGFQQWGVSHNGGAPM